MRTRISALILAAALLLTACAAPEPPDQADGQIQYDWMAGESPVSPLRTGIKRQGIYSLENSFECTEHGVYFMYSLPSGGSCILYGDHGSDTLIKLCGRPDCMHEDASCDAYFFGGVNICYDGGSLYVTTGASFAAELIRMGPDGTERVRVMDTAAVNASGGYTGMMAPMVWNGVFTFSPYKLDEAGNMVADTYYYKLDGSIEAPEMADMNMGLFNDGTHFLVEKLTGDNVSQVWLWDPETNETTYLTDGVGMGYYGTEAVYYARDGGVYCKTYATGEEELLFDSGLDGDYRLICFPDCMVLASLEDSGSADPNLYIYNWAYEPVATVELDYSFTYRPASLIVGETPERIILSDSQERLPRYYIEKAEFGAGNVNIHEYSMPDMAKELQHREEQQPDAEWLENG